MRSQLYFEDMKIEKAELGAPGAVAATSKPCPSRRMPWWW